MINHLSFCGRNNIYDTGRLDVYFGDVVKELLIFMSMCVLKKKKKYVIVMSFDRD